MNFEIVAPVHTQLTHSQIIELPARADFPLIANHPELAYLDSAATAQKPHVVLDATVAAYSDKYANVHRSVYRLGEEATVAFESVRRQVQDFLNARTSAEVVFTSGTTESINLVANGFGEEVVGAGDNVIVTVLEHHANFVPWQQLCRRKNAQFQVAGLNSAGDFDLLDLQNKLNSRTKIVAVTHLANAYGIQLPIEKIIDAAHAVGSCVLVDAAQSVAHTKLDVQKLDADFLVFSAHKLYGPSGVGVLYGKQALLERMTPAKSGGNMIERVTIAETTFAAPPARFEAGTPNIAGVIAFGAALDYVAGIGFAQIQAHEEALLSQMIQGLTSIGGVRILGDGLKHHALVCFTVDGVHPHDLAQFLDNQGVCIRAGHHCAQPLLQRLQLPATTRASVGIYNNSLDVERLLDAVAKAKRFFDA